MFAEIGVPEPEEELAKAQLASRIREIVRSSRLTQVAAAGVMGIDQPKVSALLNGRLSSFSSERLMRLLTRLGQGVVIVVRCDDVNVAAFASLKKPAPEGVADTPCGSPALTQMSVNRAGLWWRDLRADSLACIRETPGPSLQADASHRRSRVTAGSTSSSDARA